MAQSPVFPSSIQEIRVLDIIPCGSEEHPLFELHLERPDWKKWYPGQFVMIRHAETAEENPILARPISISNVTDTELVLLFQVVGRGTKKLSQIKRGERLVVWGPLGSHFAVEKTAPTLLLAGGIGIAPFVGYAAQHPSPEKVSMVFGHRLPESFYPVETLRRSIAVQTFQERSSNDLPAFIQLLEKSIQTCAEKEGLVLACGPTPFMRSVQKFAAQYGVRCQLSLEQKMACGVGACLGCVTKTTEKYPVAEKAGFPVQICLHGPVFRSDVIER